MFENGQLGALARIKYLARCENKIVRSFLQTHLPINSIGQMTNHLHNKSLNGCDIMISFALVKSWWINCENLNKNQTKTKTLSF